MSLITFQAQQISIPQEAYGLVWRSDPALWFHQKYLVPKMNEGLTGLEQHEGVTVLCLHQPVFVICTTLPRILLSLLPNSLPHQPPVPRLVNQFHLSSHHYVWFICVFSSLCFIQSCLIVVYVTSCNECLPASSCFIVWS